MNLTCKHCNHDFEASVSLDTDPGMDCIWCPVCQKLTAVKVAYKLWKRKHTDAAEVIVEWGDDD